MTKEKGSGYSPDVSSIQYKMMEELARALVREVEAMEAELSAAEKSSGGEPEIDFAGAVRRFETDLIQWALRQTDGHQRRAARLLDIKVTTLNAKIRRYGIRPGRVVREGV